MRNIVTKRFSFQISIASRESEMLGDDRTEALMDSHSILVVDDEVRNLDALKRIFRREYNVLSATNGEDGLSIMEQNDITVIIADYRMPGMTGLEFLARTLRDHPDTIRMVLSAYTNDKLLMDAINVGHIYGYIDKPWEPDEMRAIVKEGIEFYKATHAARKLHTQSLSHGGITSEEQLEKLTIESNRKNAESNSVAERLATESHGKKMIVEILVELGIISGNELDKAMKVQESDRRSGEALADLGIISSDELEAALELQLAEILVNLGYTDEGSIFFCYGLQLGMPRKMLSQFSSKPGVAKLLPIRLAYKHTIIPIDVVNGALVVAAPRPLSKIARSEIEEDLGCKVIVLCPSSGSRSGIKQIAV